MSVISCRCYDPTIRYHGWPTPIWKASRERPSFLQPSREASEANGPSTSVICFVSLTHPYSARTRRSFVRESSSEMASNRDRVRAGKHSPSFPPTTRSSTRDSPNPSPTMQTRSTKTMTPTWRFNTGCCVTKGSSPCVVPWTSTDPTPSWPRTRRRASTTRSAG